MKSGFYSEFSNSIKKIPMVEDAEPVVLNFSIIYPKVSDEKRGSKNILVVKYIKKQIGEIDLLIQSPKEEVLKDINLSDFKSVKISGKSVYKGYDPKIPFFSTSDSMNLYTIITNKNLITIPTYDRKDIELINTNNFVKLKNKILEYVFKIPDVVDDFLKCFVKFDTRIYGGHLSIIFLNPMLKTQIIMDIFEDEEKILDELINNVIVHKKKISNLLTKGKIGDRDFIFYRISKKRILVVRKMTRGKKSLTDFTKKIVQKIK